MPLLQGSIVRKGEKIMAVTGIVLILTMGALAAYMTTHYQEIRQQQVDLTREHLNARK